MRLCQGLASTVADAADCQPKRDTWRCANRRVDLDRRAPVWLTPGDGGVGVTGLRVAWRRHSHSAAAAAHFAGASPSAARTVRRPRRTAAISGASRWRPRCSATAATSSGSASSNACRPRSVSVVKTTRRSSRMRSSPTRWGTRDERWTHRVRGYAGYSRASPARCPLPCREAATPPQGILVVSGKPRG